MRAGAVALTTAVRELVACAPLHVVFAHGDLFEAPAADRLQEGFAWLLGPAAGQVNTGTARA